MSDWWEHLPEHEQNEWAVRAQLRAQRWLADQRDGYDPHEKNRKMLAAVVPKARVCCRCRRPGERMVAITGDWFCAEHDPLNRPGPSVVRCCGLTDIEICRVRRGTWSCTAGIVGHKWPHRYRRLEGSLG